MRDKLNPAMDVVGPVAALVTVVILITGALGVGHYLRPDEVSAWSVAMPCIVSFGIVVALAVMLATYLGVAWVMLSTWEWFDRRFL